MVIILIAIGASVLPLTAGQSPHQPAQSTMATITLSVMPEATKIASNPQAESDVTNGLILAGALLILVILLGTLHATWGLRKPTLPH